MPPTSALLEFTINLARKAGAYLLDAFQLAGTTAAFKEDRSFVTQADIAVDRMITDAIQADFPGDVLLSEELHTQLTEASQAVWIIDPLDGTTNFSLGLHVWGVLITRLQAGWPELSVQYFPLLDELYTTQRGGGAWLNGNQIHTKPPNPKQPYGFFACCSRTHRRYSINIHYKPRILGSAAYSFCLLARGAALISLEVAPKIWDIAGAWLLVHEAGGVINPLEGVAPFPLAAGTDYSQCNFPTLGTATLALQESSRAKIIPKSNCL